MKKKAITIFVFNAVEDEWQYLSSYSSPSVREKAIHSTNKYADCYLFAAGEQSDSRFIFISPVSVSSEFKTYVEQITGSSITVFTPAFSTGHMCLDAVKDKRCMRNLIEDIGVGSPVRLISYAPTKQTYQFARKLERLGLVVDTPHLPLRKQFRSALAAGTKDGFRRMVSSLPHSPFSSLLPPGSIYKTLTQAAKKAAQLYIQHKAVVIKSALGSAGNGVLLFREGDLPSSLDLCTKAVLKKCNEKPLWSHASLIVERYIESSASVVAFPSVEYLATEGSSRPRMLYYCAMTVKPDGEFYGMHMHSSVLPSAARKDILARSNAIASQIVARGFRGHFDIDMIVDASGTIYASESNLRYTGGTDVYLLTKRLYGRSFFSDAYVISGYRDLPDHKQFSFSTIQSMFEPILLSKKNKTGIVINSESVIRNRGLSYAAIGRTRSHAEQIITKMNALIEGT